MLKTILKGYKTDVVYRRTLLELIFLVLGIIILPIYGYFYNNTTNKSYEQIETTPTETLIQVIETTEVISTEPTIQDRPTPTPKELDIGMVLHDGKILVRFSPIEYWNNLTDEERFNSPVELKAAMCGISVEEYIFLARVIEAESDRSSSMDGRIMIAATILNRVNDDRFPDTITGVLTQSGQFTTVSGGYCSTSSTLYSEWAIVEALDGLNSGEIPDNVLYFNCIGYNCGTPYGLIDGNYFMCN